MTFRLVGRERKVVHRQPESESTGWRMDESSGWRSTTYIGVIGRFQGPE